MLGGKSESIPSWAVPGGVDAPLTPEGRDKIRAGLPEAAQATTRLALDLFKSR